MDEDEGPTIVVVDGKDSLAGLIVRRHDEDPRMLTVEAWVVGLSKRAAAHVLRQIAASWDKAAADADAEAGLN
jgi:hypothetical protein